MVLPWGFVRSKSSERLAMREKASPSPNARAPPKPKQLLQLPNIKKDDVSINISMSEGGKKSTRESSCL